jgi:hypothetical protein
MLGEFYAQSLLESDGFVVNQQSEKMRGDLQLIEPNTGELFNVEVKTAKRNKRGQFVFLLRKTGKTDFRHSDALVLLCCCKSGDIVPYILPTVILRPSRRQITIVQDPRTYAGMWANFRYKSIRAVLWQDGDYTV